MVEELMRNPVVLGGAWVLAAGAFAAAIRNLPRRIWGLVLRRFSACVEILDRDPAYAWVQAWLADQPRVGGDGESCVRTELPTNPGVRRPRFRLSPAPGFHWVTYRGRLVLMTLYRRELQQGGESSIQETIRLRILGGTRGTVLDLLREAHDSTNPGFRGVGVLTWGYQGWGNPTWKAARPLDSLVLGRGALEGFMGDLRTFLRSRDWYLGMGLPYRRGYLLHGPPGNGKTTLVLAAAAEAGMSVGAISLSGPNLNDGGLLLMVNTLPEDAILLLEDVDCAFKDDRAAADRIGVTLSGLLNAIDGVAAREGRVLIMTTNHPERLDPALVRAGRVDRRVFLPNADRDQADRLFRWFHRDLAGDGGRLDRLASEFAASIPPGELPMASLQEHLLRHRDDPEAAARGEGLAAGPGAAAG